MHTFNLVRLNRKYSIVDKVSFFSQVITNKVSTLENSNVSFKL